MHLVPMVRMRCTMGSSARLTCTKAQHTHAAAARTTASESPLRWSPSGARSPKESPRCRRPGSSTVRRTRARAPRCAPQVAWPRWPSGAPTPARRRRGPKSGCTGSCTCQYNHFLSLANEAPPLHATPLAWCTPWHGPPRSMVHPHQHGAPISMLHPSACYTP